MPFGTKRESTKFAGVNKLTRTAKSRTSVVGCRLPNSYVGQLREAFCNGGGYTSLSEFFRAAVREKAERELPQLFLLKNLHNLEEEVRAK
jgi:Arc/MetJ-type ribon-helix-helix transcriptional regulator